MLLAHQNRMQPSLKLEISPVLASQNVCCETGLLAEFIIEQEKNS